MNININPFESKIAKRQRNNKSMTGKMTKNLNFDK